MTKIAVFDFCGTFINFQTGDAFIRFVLNKHFNGNSPITPDPNHRNIVHVIHDLLSPTPLSKIVLAKKIKGVSKECVCNYAKEYAEELLYPNIIKETLSLFKECKSNGMFVVLVSAAYRPYLTEFSKKIVFDEIISSDLEVKKGTMTGRIKNDIIGKKKVKALIKCLDNRFGKNGYVIEVSVGDSKSDIPVLDLAKKSIVVSADHQDWIKKNYEEIIYEH